MKARISANPCRALLILTAVLFVIVLCVLGIYYPPGPLGRLSYGPISLSLIFPAHNLAGREPILAGGVRGNAYIVAVENAGTGQVRFVYETWGAAEQLSAPVTIAPGNPYSVNIDLPQLRAPTQEAGVPLSIVFNGNLLMRQEVPYAQLAVKSLWIGTNPLNGPYLGRDVFPGPPKPYAFSGKILDVQRIETGQAVPPGISSFIANRFLPNLRYEVEIAPHIFYWSFLTSAIAALMIILLLLPGRTIKIAFVGRLRRLFTPVLITALPVLPLLQISRTYRADWLNHGWIMEYYGQFLRAHYWLPHTINSHQAVGLVSPLFYGHMLYSIGGFFSMVAGADIGLRLALFTALLCQTLCVRRTVWRLTSSLAFADTLSALVCWAIYPFSNLYGGSVMEFMAVCYLTCCVCIFIDFCHNSSARIVWLEVAEFALFFDLAANHPITGMLGGLMLGAMTLLTLTLSRHGRQIGRSLLAASLLTLFFLSPWIYMYSQHGKELFISRETAGNKLEYFEFDTWAARFMPFPYDAKSISIGALSETSYADMQLNLPLLIAGLTGVIFARRSPWRVKPSSLEELPAKGLLWLGWLILAWALMASLYPQFAQITSAITNRLRYAFRLVNVQNLGLLLIALAWCWIYALRGGFRRGIYRRVWLPVMCSALLAVTSVSMLQKWAHGSAATQQSAIGHSLQRALILPYTFYWLMDYVGLAPEAGAVAQTKQSVEIPVADGAHFGETQPVDISLSDKRWLLFNTVASPTNQIFVDGAPLAEKDIYREWAKIAIQLNPGNHRIEYRFEPGAVWTFLRIVTESLFFALATVRLYWELKKKPKYQ